MKVNTVDAFPTLPEATHFNVYSSERSGLHLLLEGGGWTQEGDVTAGI